jgi:hypothetical protein
LRKRKEIGLQLCNNREPNISVRIKVVVLQFDPIILSICENQSKFGNKSSGILVLLLTYQVNSSQFFLIVKCPY